MEKIKLFKKNDIILVIVLLLLAAAGLFVFRFLNSGEGKKVRVTIDGELFGEYELSDGSGVDGNDDPEYDAVAGSVIGPPGNDGTPKENGTGAEKKRIKIPGRIGRCVLVIEDGKAYMEEADCPNQICVHHSPVSHKGETIVCLPNRVVIEVQ